MKFLDEAKIYIKAGDGGDGCLSFRREKFIEFGGPNGGDGGRGGSVYVVGVENVNTLIDYRYQQHFKVKKGKNGEGQNKTGHSSEDIILKVPIGTQILDEDKVTEIVDITEEGQKVLLAEGGIGGLGNARFKTSVNQAPRRTTLGTLGEEKWIWLKLKLIADIGLVGMPNAGKSSFIRKVTNTKAKTGDYPFTTLKPQLGVIRIDNTKEVIIADIPGIIKNAHLCKGLGHKFLAHIERCSVLIHIIDASAGEPILDYQTIRNEMSLYNKVLAAKKEIVVLNKIDLLNDKEIKNRLIEFKKLLNQNIFFISTFDKKSCEKVVKEIFVD
jgi:GTP-binding protein